MGIEIIDIKKSALYSSVSGKTTLSTLPTQLQSQKKENYLVWMQVSSTWSKWKEEYVYHLWKITQAHCE